MGLHCVASGKGADAGELQRILERCVIVITWVVAYREVSR